ncbi:putative acetyltransferase [compost metagenome]
MSDPANEYRITAAVAADAPLVAALIRDSFKVQAQQLNLTEVEYPNYVAFETERAARQRIQKSRVDLLWHGRTPLGTIGYAADSIQGNIERLAVLPAHRGQALGKLLLTHAELELFVTGQCQMISLSIVASFGRLRHYYESLGYRSLETRRYPSLPFAVLHMQKTIDTWRGGQA